MGRLMINAILLLIMHELCFVATATDQETCEYDREMEEQCRIHNYKNVKPLLDYFRQVRNELEDKEIKENKLNALNSDLMEKYHEIVRIHEKIMKEAALLDEYKSKIQKGENDLQLCQNNVDKLESENNSQKRLIENLSPISKLIENYDICKVELTGESNKLMQCEIELKKINSSLLERATNISEYTAKIQNLTEYQKKVELQLKESQSKLIKQDKNNQICNAEVDILVRIVNASSCIPFADYPGIHKIKVSELDFFDVPCDSQLAGPGWIVIQQRVGGNESFHRDWATYRKGFGSLDSDFFLGLEKIHQLTNSRRHELYVHLVALNGTVYYARYDDFKISDENNKYALSLGGFMGNVSDAMRHGENFKFTTFDYHDDNRCADFYKSGWWYNLCYDCNLNAVYGKYFNWYLDVKIILKEAKMLIRPKEEVNK